MSARDRSACDICGSTSYSIAYEGPVRAGAFGSLTPPLEVRRCGSCRTSWLSECIEDCADYYESKRYRAEVDGDSSVETFAATHDREQPERVARVGLAAVRGATVADIGCGGGSFLDAVSGYAKECVAIEPAEHFRVTLEERGYTTFAYAQDYAEARPASVDVTTCFSVIEHVEDPVGLLAAVAKLLRPGGRLVLSTPNARDALLDLLPDAYPPFFYRKAHLHYFDEASITRALELAGFERISVSFHQRFGVGNALGWMRERRPVGDATSPHVTPAMDAVWKTELERTGVSDYLYAEAMTKVPD